MHKLNDDCLLAVAAYLPTLFDLFRTLRVDKRFRRILCKQEGLWHKRCEEDPFAAMYIYGRLHQWFHECMGGPGKYNTWEAYKWGLDQGLFYRTYRNAWLLRGPLKVLIAFVVSYHKEHMTIGAKLSWVQYEIADEYYGLIHPKPFQGYRM